MGHTVYRIWWVCLGPFTRPLLHTQYLYTNNITMKYDIYLLEARSGSSEVMSKVISLNIYRNKRSKCFMNEHHSVKQEDGKGLLTLVYSLTEASPSRVRTE